jgi:aspartyl/asparaginyl-tRNA synthetase
MEKNFIKSFYHIELEMTFIDLTDLVYQPEESVNAYFQWFMKKTLKCSAYIPKANYIQMILKRMNWPMQKKLIR